MLLNFPNNSSIHFLSQLWAKIKICRLLSFNSILYWLDTCSIHKTIYVKLALTLTKGYWSFFFSESQLNRAWLKNKAFISTGIHVYLIKSCPVHNLKTTTAWVKPDTSSLYCTIIYKIHMFTNLKH